MAISLGTALLGSSIVGGGLGLLGTQLAANTQANASQQSMQAQLAMLQMAERFQRENQANALAATNKGIDTYNQYIPLVVNSLFDAQGALGSGRTNASNALQGNVGNAIGTASDFGGRALQNFNAGISDARDWTLAGRDWQANEVNNALGQARRDLEYGSGGAQHAIGNALAYNNNSLSPYMGAGNNATTTLAQLYGLQGQDAQTAAFGQFEASPDYQFAQREGMRALEGSNAAKGLLQSSGHMRTAQQYGQNLASQQYGNYVNRLQGLANTGLTATNTSVAANQNAGNSLAGVMSGYGNNLANASMGAGGALSNIYGQNFGSMAGLATQQGAGAAGLLTGTGNTLTGLYSGLGTGLAGIETGYGQGLTGLHTGLAGTYQNFGSTLAGLNANQAGLFTNQGNALANLAVQGGNAVAAGLTGAGQANASGIVGGTNAVTGALGNMSNQLLLGSLMNSKNGGNIFGTQLFGG
jgi:hypothetical protein